MSAIRKSIRDCWDRSDNGASFAAALAERGLILSQGTRRDFVVVDHAGGVHALGKRITGSTAAETRARMADIDRAQLPSVDAAKVLQAEHAQAREVMLWEDQLAAAAIAKELREKNLVADDKAVLRITDRMAERDAAYHLSQASRPMTIAEKRVAEALEVAPEGLRLTDTLKEQSGFTLARASAEDLKQLSVERALAFATDEGRYIPRVRKGELVAVNKLGEVRSLNPHRIDLDTVAKIAEAEQGGKISSIAEARAAAMRNPPEPYERGPYVSTTLLRAREFDGRLGNTASPVGPIARTMRSILTAVTAPLDIASKFLSGEGKPNPASTTPQQRASRETERQLKQAGEHKETPTISETERLRNIETSQRLEEQFRRDFERDQKEHEADRWRGRQRGDR